MSLELQRYGRNKNTLVNKTYIESGEYRRKFDKISGNDSVNRALYSKAKEALQHRSGTVYEDMFWIDTTSGNIILEVTDSTVERAILYTDPSSMPPSISDFNSCYRNNYKQGIVACHNGKIFAYTSKQEINEALYNMYIESYIKEGYSEFDS